MYIFCQVLTLFLFQVHASDVKDLPEYKPFASIVKGVFINPLPSVTVYESSIPLTFVVNLPKEPEPLSPSSECRAPADFCKLKNYYSLMYKTRFTDISDHPYIHLKANPAPTRTVRNVNNFEWKKGVYGVLPVGPAFKVFYGVATQEDVAELHGREDYITKRQDEIKQAVFDDHKNLVTLTTELNTYHQNMTAILNERFQDVRQRVIKESETVYLNEATLLEILSISLKAEYISSMTMLMDSVGTDCRNHLIPRSVLSDKQIAKSIKVLDANLFMKGYTVASTLNQLWKLKICDCVFTKTQVSIAVHVPIRRINVTWQLLEVIRVAYQFKGYQCFLNDHTEYLGINSEEIIPISPRMAKRCKPDEEKLCLIPQHISDDTKFLTCAQALISNAAVNIREACSFTCHKSSNLVITDIGDGQIAVTNAKVVDFMCKNSSNSRRFKVEHNVGAIVLRVPCTCSVKINENKTIPPPFPCPIGHSSDIQNVTQIIPSHYATIRDLIFKDTEPSYTNISEIINWKWNQKFAVVNISTPTPLNFSAAYMAGKLWNDVQESNSMVYPWLIILTIVQVVSVLYVCTPSGGTIFSPLRLISIISCIPFVCCADEDNDDQLTFTTALLQLLKTMEITTLILALGGTVVGLWLLVVVYRIQRTVRSTYRIIKNNLA